MFESAITFWFKDVDFDGDKVWEYFQDAECFSLKEAVACVEQVKEVKENEMAMGMGIHGEPGVWNGPLKTSREIAEESLNTLLTDMPVADCEEVSILINGLGATSIEELYILSNDVTQILNSKGIKIYKTIVGEYATSMEMAGASISICKMNDELKKYMDHPVNTPFICQK